LGVVRLILENELRLPIKRHVSQQGSRIYDWGLFKDRTDGFTDEAPLVTRDGVTLQRPSSRRVGAVTRDLLAFFADRLKVQLREQGARHDLVDAVFALEGQDDLLLIVRRVEALGKFLDTEDGKNLLAGYKRATNIIRIEE